MESVLKTSHSSEIKELVAALSKAQGVMKPAVFNKKNPHFKSRYADFASCMDACRIPLSENGIAPIQYCETIDGKLSLVTMLAHVSGQWMKSEFPLVSAKMDSQGIGSAMTYAKRYSLCGMVGIVADEDGDDDAEAAVGRGKQEEVKQALVVQPKKISSQDLTIIRNLEAKLNTECKNKINIWLKDAYNIENLEDVTVDILFKVLVSFENAVKFMEQSKLEVSNA